MPGFIADNISDPFSIGGCFEHRLKEKILAKGMAPCKTQGCVSPKKTKLSHGFPLKPQQESLQKKLCLKTGRLGYMCLTSTTYYPQHIICQLYSLRVPAP